MQNRLNIFKTDKNNKKKNKLNPSTLLALQNILHKCNPYVKKFKQFAKDSSNIENLQMVLKTDSTIDRRVCNLPSASEIAVVIPGILIISLFSNYLITLLSDN